MKYKLHVPTEQFGFCEVELESDSGAEYACAVYREVAQAFASKPVNAMPEVDFRRLYDLVGHGKTIDDDPGVLQKMSPVQQVSLNDLKKFIKRVNSK